MIVVASLSDTSSDSFQRSKSIHSPSGDLPLVAPLWTVCWHVYNGQIPVLIQSIGRAANIFSTFKDAQQSVSTMPYQLFPATQRLIQPKRFNRSLSTMEYFLRCSGDSRVANFYVKICMINRSRHRGHYYGYKLNAHRHSQMICQSDGIATRPTRTKSNSGRLGQYAQRVCLSDLRNSLSLTLLLLP